MATPQEYWSAFAAYYGHDADKSGLQAVQTMAGIPVTGELDAETIQSIKQPRCGVPDTLPMRMFSRWRKNRLTYVVESYVEGLSQVDQSDIIRSAWNSWEEVCDVQLRPIGSREGADIVISTGRGPRAGFDGPSGTLAWAQLPSGYDQPLLMRFDLSERWAIGNDPGILLLNVAAHEFGHLLGLEHSRVSTALMAPFYTRGISKPQADDIARIQAYYGPAVLPPQPPPSPPSPPIPPTQPGGTMRDIVKTVVGFALSIFLEYAKSTANPLDNLVANYLIANQDKLIDLILGRFGQLQAITQAQAATEVARLIQEVRTVPVSELKLPA